MSKRVSSWEVGRIPVPFRFTVWVEESAPTWVQDGDRTWEHNAMRAVHCHPVTVWAWNHIHAGEKVRRREGIDAPLEWTRR